MRYCAKRAGFYTTCADWTTLVSLIGGTAVFADVIGNMPIASTIGSVLIVSASLGSLVFKWPEKAQFWHIQRTKYGQLEARFKRLGAAMTEPQFNDLKADMAMLEADSREGSTRNNLYAICHNEECSARDSPQEDKILLRWYQRLFAPFFDMSPSV